MKLTWKDDRAFQHGKFTDLYVGGKRVTGYFVSNNAGYTEGIAGHAGPANMAHPDLATAFAWVEAQYMLREGV
jgi:hypothetical protein